MTNTARNILDSITGYVNSAGGSIPRSTRMAVIDPYYTVGNPRVIFEGETRLAEKAYPFASGYSPTAGDRVYMVPVGQSYIIVNKVNTVAPTQPFYHGLSLKNGWKNYGDSYSHLRVTRTTNGVVIMEGLVGGGKGIIATLPEPFRPTTMLRFGILSSVVGPGQTPDYVSIYPNGDIIPASLTKTYEWVTVQSVIFNNDPDLQWNPVTPVNSWTASSLDESGGPVYSKDRLGRVWFTGTLSRSTPPAGETAAFVLPAGFRPEFQMHFAGTGGSVFSGNDILADGSYRWKSYSGTSAQNWFINNSLYLDSSIKGWTNMTTLGGWVRNATAHPPMSYHKDADNIVHLRGLVRSGAGAIAILPEGYRPGGRLLIPAVAGDAWARVDITTAGRIEPSNGSNVWFSLDGMTFVAEN